MINSHSLFENWTKLNLWFAAHWLELASAAGIALLVALALLAVRHFGRRMICGSNAIGWRKVLEGVIDRTNLFFIIMVAAKLVSAQVELPVRIHNLINFLFVVATAFQVAVWVRALIIGSIEQRVGEGEEHRTLGTAMGLIRVLVSVAAFLIAIIVVLDNLGVNVTGLVAGLGIGGIAIGLAAQGIFSDLFAALAIIFDRPFRRGDSINVGGGASGVAGTVENIGLKSTRIRSLDGEMVAYGNAELLKQRLHNMTVMHQRRVMMRFGLRYETPVEQLASVPDEMKRIVEAHEQTRFDRSHMVAFGASSVDYETVFFVEAPDYATFAQVRHDVMLAVMRRFAELDIAFAYPTQTTYTAAPDGTLVMPWPPAAEPRERD